MANDELRSGRDPEPAIPAPPRWSKNANKDNKQPCWKTARTRTEKLDCLSKIQQEYPNDPVVRKMIYQEVKEVIDRDPYLEYHAETTNTYRVIDRAQEVLIVPKERAAPEPFPPRRPEPIRMAYRYLLFSLLGLFLSGLGAMVFAPIAERYAFSALSKARTHGDQIRAAVVGILAPVLFVLGLALTLLLYVHFIG